MYIAESEFGEIKKKKIKYLKTIEKILIAS